MDVIIYFIIGAIVFAAGIGIAYLCFRPSRIKILEKNRETAEVNRSLEETYEQLKSERDNIDQEILSLQKEKDILTTSLEQQKNQTEQYLNDLLAEKMKLINERFDRASETLCKKYQDTEEDYKKEYLNTMEEMTEAALEQLSQQREELSTIETKLKNAKAKQSAVIQLLKREEEKRDNINFYKLQLSEVDLKEIAKLREVAQFLRNEEPLNKVIWKSYYEKPFTDLTGRIIGQNIVCGIYKITNLENQKVYIGQSVDIKSRLRTHIKRGLGAETPTRNKLYSIMKKVGVENFSYEIIEECPRDQLNDRECYWISYFESQDYGYNETKGGA